VHARQDFPTLSEAPAHRSVVGSRQPSGWAVSHDQLPCTHHDPRHWA
jgi:hypothetical protein